MMYWQLSAILSDEPTIKKKYLPDNLIEIGRTEVYEDIVLSALVESTKIYYTTEINTLREFGKGYRGEKILEKFPILEAYYRYGGDAISEVIDFGSWGLNRKV